MRARQRILVRSLLGLAAAASLAASPQRGMGPRGHDAAHDQDMQVFQTLIDHRDSITRTVTRLPNGIETVTESSDPAITELLQMHVDAMLARVREGRPIHQRDPLFAELFRLSDRIQATHSATATGVKVVETSDDPYVVQLLYAHADVVGGFIANGRAELMKNHPVPPAPAP